MLPSKTQTTEESKCNSVRLTSSQEQKQVSSLTVRGKIDPSSSSLIGPINKEKNMIAIFRSTNHNICSLQCHNSRHMNLNKPSEED